LKSSEASCAKEREGKATSFYRLGTSDEPFTCNDYR
jgi:hypothetical protein